MEKVRHQTGSWIDVIHQKYYVVLDFIVYYFLLKMNDGEIKCRRILLISTIKIVILAAPVLKKSGLLTQLRWAVGQLQPYWGCNLNFDYRSFLWMQNAEMILKNKWNKTSKKDNEWDCIPTSLHSRGSGRRRGRFLGRFSRSEETNLKLRTDQHHLFR